MLKASGARVSRLPSHSLMRRLERSNFRVSFHKDDSKKPNLAGPRLGGIGVGSGLLATELDAARCADGLSVLPALAWIHFGGRRAGVDARRQFVLVAFR